MLLIQFVNSINISTFPVEIIQTFKHNTYLIDLTLTDYETTYASALQKDNFYGVQFHPEKSGIEGSRILQNFIEL